MHKFCLKGISYRQVQKKFSLTDEYFVSAFLFCLPFTSTDAVAGIKSVFSGGQVGRVERKTTWTAARLYCGLESRHVTS